MDTSEIQHNFFQLVKGRVTENVSAVDEIAKLLEISIDSAYRRMKGEKPITLDELHKLCTHYRISLDRLMNIQTGAFVFEGSLIDSEKFGFENYLTGMMKNLAYFNSFKQREFYYTCKDMPIFYHFVNRDFGAFKYWHFMRSIYHFPEFANKKFSFKDYPEPVFQMGLKIVDLYNHLPCVEFWNVENLNASIRQVEFYRESQWFESDADVCRVYEGMEAMLNLLEKQASLGIKFREGEQKPLGTASYGMYFNEMVMGDNHMMVVLDGVKMALLSHTAINYMATRDIAFTENMYGYLQNLMKRSTLISSQNEKERIKFFRLLRERIANRKDNLKI